MIPCSFLFYRRNISMCLTAYGQERENRIRRNDGILHERDIKKMKELSSANKTGKTPGRCKHGDYHPRKNRPPED
jgi:hypothetical protein